MIKLWEDASEYNSKINDHFIKNKNLIFYVPRDLFGSEGRLIEIMNDEDQALAVKVIQAAEASFEISDPELSYWWTGLQDPDDDGVWTWVGSKENYIYLTIIVQ